MLVREFEEAVREDQTAAVYDRDTGTHHEAHRHLLEYIAQLEAADVAARWANIGPYYRR